MSRHDQPHILVVDDDDRLRDLLTRYLGENGFVVSAARNAAEARSSLAGMQFDLLVLDVLMPGEKGVDLARSLRGEGTKVPILLLTALSSPVSLSFGSKPFCVAMPKYQRRQMRTRAMTNPPWRSLATSPLTSVG